MNTEEYENGNEINIYTKLDAVKDSKTIIIITHGIAEHSGRYQYFVESLNKYGYSVLRYDLLGHGKSGGPRGDINDFNLYIDILYSIVEQMKKEYSRVILFGHSMGGEIVNLYNAKYHDVDLIISSAAAVDTPKEAKFLKFIPYKLLYRVKQKTSFGPKLTHNASIVEQYKNDPLVLPYFYASIAGEMFIKGVRYIKKNIPNMIVPTLFLHGGEDKIVNPKFSEKLYNKLPITDKKLIIYPNSRHEILNEDNKDIVIQDITIWIKQHE
jgi:alpha-beta hydrolase superfamily lysophospholipase